MNRNEGKRQLKDTPLPPRSCLPDWPAGEAEGVTGTDRPAGDGGRVVVGSQTGPGGGGWGSAQGSQLQAWGPALPPTNCVKPGAKTFYLPPLASVQWDMAHGNSSVTLRHSWFLLPSTDPQGGHRDGGTLVNPASAWEQPGAVYLLTCVQLHVAP